MSQRPIEGAEFGSPIRSGRSAAHNLAWSGSTRWGPSALGARATGGLDWAVALDESCSRSWARRSSGCSSLRTTLTFWQEGQMRWTVFFWH
eukprot:6986346-Karenia_brevis.AAC.1